MVWILLLSGVDLSTRALTAGNRLRAFGVRQDLIGGEALASNRSLYLAQTVPTLPLKAFRGVRAISKFDWPFTPTLISSESFSTLTSWVLQSVLPDLQPGQV